MTLAINGDLGSGKSALSRVLSERLGLPRVSLGDVQRQLAREKHMTTLQLNERAEADEEVDHHLDDYQRGIAQTGEPVIVDSRLGWLFFPAAYRIHLVVDPVVGALRVMARPASDVESYESPQQAVRHLNERRESERARFITKYGVDLQRLRNYDVVVDTSRISIDEAADLTIKAMHESRGRDGGDSRVSEPALLINPNRLYPTDDITSLRGLWGSEFVAQICSDGWETPEPVTLGFSEGEFFIIDGHRRVSASLQCGFRLVRARLGAEGPEEVIGNLSADDFLFSEVRAHKTYDWEAAHKIELPALPHWSKQLGL